MEIVHQISICVIICLAKILEISIQSVKTVCMVKGERKIAAVLAFIGYAIYKIKTKGLKAAAIEFIVNAEKEFKKGQNSEKMEYVYNALIALLPAPIKVFITKQTLINFIQRIFDEVKIALDYIPVEKGE